MALKWGKAVTQVMGSLFGAVHAAQQGFANSSGRIPGKRIISGEPTSRSTSGSSSGVKESHAPPGTYLCPTRCRIFGLRIDLERGRLATRDLNL